jgi:succinate dehydrogenase/fumarate reductase-like Fe-S protein
MTHPTISVRCFRYDPEADPEPRFQDYQVPLQDGEMSVLDCLDHIREHLDPGLAYFKNCQLGFCQRCSLRVNGKVVMACETAADGDLVLEPVNADEVIRDLWCNST